jgi:molybdopterin/thiamine biosynthesis adenylyltransferase
MVARRVVNGPPPQPTEGHVVVLGAGGNIGSSLVRYLARIQSITRLTLIDCDSYEVGNLVSQGIRPVDVGRQKVMVQAEAVREIRPDLDVMPIKADLESLPMGWFACDLLLSCVDNARARQTINRIAWRLDVPWLDAGISADGLLIRLDAFQAESQKACLECAWTPRDYEAIDQKYLCDAKTRGSDTLSSNPVGQAVAPSGAPAALGGVVGAIQALEAEKFLTSSDQCLAPGSQVVLSTGHHRFQHTSRPRNPDCRFDHETWSVRAWSTLPASATLRELFDLGRSMLSTTEPLELSCDGFRFSVQLACSLCGRPRAHLRLIPHPMDWMNQGKESPPCSFCGGRMVVTGWGLSDHLSEAELKEGDLERTLKNTGIREREVLSVRSRTNDDNAAHIQVGLHST